MIYNPEMQFEKLLQHNWRKVFEDKGNEDWHNKWFLDGKKATITNTEKGMDFYAGPTFLDDSCHGVLWTKESFEGDIKIEYDYTRLDQEYRCVNILYLQATGMGVEPYVEDIMEWKELREKPAMNKYFEKMHTYHISYAAFSNNDKVEPGYIRARRYMATELEGTDLKLDYDPEGFFEYGVPHKITVIKSGDFIYFHVKNSKKSLLCHWHNTEFPSITKGRIGLRHMFTRGARYYDFKVFIND